MTAAAEAVSARSWGRLARPGSATVWRLEVAKLCRQVPVLGVLALSVVAPFVFVVGLKVQSTVPQDTLFGRWVHESGFAVPLVVLGFSAQWALPVVISVVAGDMFAAEDHFGTWKTVLTRGVSRGQVFAGKTAAAFTYAVVATTVLAGASVLAGLLMGTQPVVGLTGQLVAPGRALALVAVSWASVLPAVVVFSALGLLFSVWTRSRPASLGSPVVIAWALQLLTLVNIPAAVSAALPSVSFATWHGFWASPAFDGPFLRGVITSAVWTALLVGAAAVLFLRRNIATR